MPMTNRWGLWCLGTIVAAALAGCEAAPLRFRVTDGSTAQPLPGVRVRVWQRSFDLPIGPVHGDTVALEPSGDDGMVRAEHLKPWNLLFVFEKEGYVSARAEQLSVDPDRVLLPMSDPRRLRPISVDEVIDVRMMPVATR